VNLGYLDSSLSQLTQQDEDAGQDGDERPPAEAGGQAVRLGVARHDVAVVVAAAHADGHRAGAGVHRLLAVGDEDGQVEDGLVPLGPASSPGQDPRRVVWTRDKGGSGEGGSVPGGGQGIGQSWGFSSWGFSSGYQGIFLGHYYYYY